MMTSGDRPRVLVMRHPETVANVEHWFSGRRDVNLTPAGDAQRLRAIEALVAWGPDRIWCSPLCRCLSIAAVAAERLGMETEVDERLAEIEFGRIEGVTWEEMHEMGYRFPWPIGSDGRSRPCPGGESFEGLVARAGAVLESLRPLPGRTALVTHGGFTRGLLCAAYGGSLSDFWHMTIPNVASQVLTTDGRTFSLEAFGLTPEEVERRVLDPDADNQDSSRGEDES